MPTTSTVSIVFDPPTVNQQASSLPPRWSETKVVNPLGSSNVLNDANDATYVQITRQATDESSNWDTCHIPFSQLEAPTSTDLTSITLSTKFFMDVYKHLLGAKLNVGFYMYDGNNNYIFPSVLVEQMDYLNASNPTISGRRATATCEITTSIPLSYVNHFIKNNYVYQYYILYLQTKLQKQ